MFSNHKGASVVVAQLERFMPPYCRNPECEWHRPEAAANRARFHRIGWRTIQRKPYRIPKFRCLKCRAIVSSSFFGFSYRDRLEPNYAELLFLKNGGMTKLRLAERFRCSRDTILRRLRKIARQSVLVQAKLTEKLKIEESIAYDGIENFAFSQFDPNNINHAIGRASYFVYDFNFCPFNRKGVMSPAQKLKKKRIENTHGRYPAHTIRESTRRIVDRLVERTPGDLHFHSDNHYAYRDVIRPRGKRIVHHITPARAVRNFQNDLFAINHLDLLTRQRASSFKRETIAFSKHSVAMLEDFALLVIEKNFMRPIFEKKHAKDPSANRESPAMRVGITNRIFRFNELFKVRVTKTQVRLNEDAKNLFERVDLLSRRPIQAYTGI